MLLLRFFFSCFFCFFFSSGARSYEIVSLLPPPPPPFPPPLPSRTTFAVTDRPSATSPRKPNQTAWCYVTRNSKLAHHPAHTKPLRKDCRPAGEYRDRVLPPPTPGSVVLQRATDQVCRRYSNQQQQHHLAAPAPTLRRRDRRTPVNAAWRGIVALEAEQLVWSAAWPTPTLLKTVYGHPLSCST